MELKDVKSPQDLKHCSVEELYHLASQIRETIIGQVAKHGGHLANNNLTRKINSFLST